jgi:hypothetical protein
MIKKITTFFFCCLLCLANILLAQTIVNFTLTTSTVSEATLTHTVALTITNPDAVNPVQVNLILGGTALNKTDYYIANQTLYIPAGATTFSFTFPVIQDWQRNVPNKTLTLTLTAPSGGDMATLGGTINHTVTFTDDDTYSATALPGMVISECSEVAPDFFELLVQADNFDARGYQLRVANPGNTTWKAPVIFANHPLWQNLRRGTIIVVTNNNLATDIDPVDGYLEIGEDNTTYFLPNATDINMASGVDVCGAGQILTPGGAHLHGIAWIRSCNVVPAGFATGNAVWRYIYLGVGQSNNHTGGPGNFIVGTTGSLTVFRYDPPSKGAPNNGGCCASTNVWQPWREPFMARQTYSINRTAGGYQMSWLAAVDPVKSDGVTGYLVLRNTTNTFGLPADGTDYTIGGLIGTATVVGKFYHSAATGDIITFNDNPGPGCFYYRVYAMRYRGAGVNTSRGVQYNTTAFVELLPYVWTGATSSDWFTASNWCINQVPNCSFDVYIPSGAPNMPIINNNGASCRSLYIDGAPASLTINSGFRLDVCGDWYNGGTFTAQNNTDVVFLGSLEQTMSGSMTPPNQFYRLTIDKNAASVTTLNSGATTESHFSIASIVSNFSHGVSGNRLYVGGNYTQNGTLTATTSLVEFYSATNHIYTRGGSAIGDFYDLSMNGTGELQLANADAVVTNTLALGTGLITTNAYKVNITNSAIGAVSSGNTNSYVNGFLQRSINSTGNYIFPVGTTASAKGYQLIEYNFTAPTGYTALLASFSDAHVGAHPTAAECGNDGYDAWIGNGQWTVSGIPSSPVTLGTYNIIAHPRNFTALYTTGDYTPVTGTMSATIAKQNGAMPWGLEGVCVPGVATSNLAGPAPIVMRNNITSGFSNFGIVVDANAPFPVELLAFTAVWQGSDAKLNWAVGTEINCYQYEILRSLDGASFESIATVRANNRDGSSYQRMDLQVAYLPTTSVFYRLKIYDNDGTSRLGPLAELAVPTQSVPAQIYPNPVKSGEVCTIETDAELLVLWDATGRRVSEYIVNGGRLDFSTATLPAGVYFLRGVGVSLRLVVTQ